MKILICAPFWLDQNSAGLNRISRLSKSLVTKGMSVTLMARTDKSPAGAFLSQKKEIAFNPVKKNFHSRALSIAFEAASFFRKNLDQILDENDFDGIIIYSTFSPIIDSVRTIAHKRGLFVVVDAVEKFNPDFQYLLNGVWLMQFFGRCFSMRKVNGIIAISPKWASYSERINIPSILLPSFFDPEEINYEDHKKPSLLRIVFVGSLTHRELPLQLFRAINLIAQKRQVELQIVGKQGKDFKSKSMYKKLLKFKFHHAAQINFSGFLEREDFDQLLMSSSIFVLLRPQSSETAHLFPTRLPEYFAYRKPVIISNVEPFNIFFKHCREVYFIDNDRSGRNLADAINKVIDDRQLNKTLVEGAWNYASGSLSFDVLGEKLSKFLIGLKSQC